jgi:hypothetical protein
MSCLSLRPAEQVIASNVRGGSVRRPALATMPISNEPAAAVSSITANVAETASLRASSIRG